MPEKVKLTKQGLNSEETRSAKTTNADAVDRNDESSFKFGHLLGFHNVYSVLMIG